MTPEERARQLIDARLVQSGWVVQDLKKVNPMASLGVAVREYPTSFCKRSSNGCATSGHRSGFDRSIRFRLLYLLSELREVCKKKRAAAALLRRP